MSPISSTPNKYSKRDPYTGKTGYSNIDPKSFDSLIATQGIRWIHEKVAICPNITGRLDTGVHDVNCQLCDNSLIHFDATEIWALLQRTRLNKMFEAHGTWDIGSAIIVTPSKKENGDPFDINYFDRFTAVDFNVRFSEIFEHSGTDVDVLKYKVTDIIYMASKEHVFILNSDFRMTEAGQVKWISDRRPNYDFINRIGDVVSCVYYTPLVMRVLDMNHEHRYVSSGVRSHYKNPQALPQSAVVKRDFLIESRDIHDKLVHPEIMAQVTHPRAVDIAPVGYVNPESEIS